MTKRNITLHHGDLPTAIATKLGNTIAMDCEMMGLNALRDKLCLVQLSDNGTDIHLVKFDITKSYNAPNLVALLNDETKTKIFHFAVADMETLTQYLNAEPKGIYCTKMAARLCRTYTDAHGLKATVKNVLGIDLPKTSASSNWGQAELSQAQIDYAAEDVFYLHDLKEHFDVEVEKLGRTQILAETNRFIPTLAKLNLQGWTQNFLAHH